MALNDARPLSDDVLRDLDGYAFMLKGLASSDVQIEARQLSDAVYLLDSLLRKLRLAIACDYHDHVPSWALSQGQRDALRALEACYMNLNEPDDVGGGEEVRRG